MLVERSLARELFVEHELAGVLRIEVKLVNKAAGLLACGRNQRMQLLSEFLFMAYSCLEVDVQNDWGLCHLFP